MDLTRKRLERGRTRVPQTHSLDGWENLKLPKTDFTGESVAFRESKTAWEEVTYPFPHHNYYRAGTCWLSCQSW
jgi:hypothetical protein